MYKCCFYVMGLFYMSNGESLGTENWSFYEPLHA